MCVCVVFVTKLSFVPAHKDKRQEQAVQLSREHTTLLASLQELRKRLQDRHGFRCVQAVAKKAAVDAQAAAVVHTPSVLESMMLFQQVKKHT